MTSFRIEELRFDPQQLAAWAPLDARFSNWPVVYSLEGNDEIYVGESLNAVTRLRQHLDSDKKRLTTARVVVDDTFNKSACLDLESYLIRLFAGDGKYRILNRNDGITNADYYRRDEYRQTFDAIFEELRALGALSRPVREIQNSDLFKLSPFKALTPDQAAAVEDILDGLFADLAADAPSQVVIQGDPGTGKTVIGVYLMKLLRDIQSADTTLPHDTESAFSEFFTEGYPELLRDFKVAMVIPQQSLRRSIQKVFAKTPGLNPGMAITPFQVAESPDRFDLLIVDEAHRLNQRASLASGMQNRLFGDINKKLFGEDDPALTQLDWLTAQSKHQIFLLDAAQSVRPADVSRAVLDDFVTRVEASRRRYRLTTQMRVSGGADYVRYVRAVLSPSPPERRETFGEYDLRLFEDLGEMYRVIREKDKDHGLARLLAGYAWEWRTKKDRDAYDIELDGLKLRWNKTELDWVNSAGSLDQVGSIHTIQGYDLNYAGVIIGPDLRYNPDRRQLFFDRSNYYDRKGKENNRARGISYSDDDLLQFVTNIYSVLLTRGMLGTYVYVCDSGLRAYLRRYL
jgi:DUF2075 family protein